MWSERYKDPRHQIYYAWILSRVARRAESSMVHQTYNRQVTAKVEKCGAHIKGGAGF
jgi:hypothetical protein